MWPLTSGGETTEVVMWGSVSAIDDDKGCEPTSILHQGWGGPDGAGQLGSSLQEMGAGWWVVAASEVAASQEQGQLLTVTLNPARLAAWGPHGLHRRPGQESSC